MKKLIIALCLLLSACYTTPYPWEILESTNGCLGPFQVQNNQGTIDHNAILKNESILKYLFTHPWTYNFDGGVYVNGPTFETNKEFCDAFGGVHITYEWNWEFPCSSSQCWGLTTSTQGIFLEYSGRALAHELIHVYEGEMGILNTGDHPNWDLKGYYWLNDTLWDAQFFHPVIGLDGGTQPPYPPDWPFLETKL